MSLEQTNKVLLCKNIRPPGKYQICDVRSADDQSSALNKICGVRFADDLPNPSLYAKLYVLSLKKEHTIKCLQKRTHLLDQDTSFLRRERLQELASFCDSLYQ